MLESNAEILQNLYILRHDCLASIATAEASGAKAKANKYRKQLAMLNKLIVEHGGDPKAHAP